jgi:hypothetical protein
MEALKVGIEVEDRQKVMIDKLKALEERARLL